MDELELVRDLHGSQGPDARAKARVWGRIQAERRRARRRLFSWTAVVAGLAAAAMVLWLTPPATDLVVDASPGPSGTPTEHGRMVLLAAAGSAAATRAGGAFWHLRQQQGAKVAELWASEDGRAWSSDGRRVRAVKGVPFSMAGKDLTFAQIQRLPGDDAKLRARVVAMLPANAGDDVLADALLGLLWRKPSPPGVRAAAYRLLADLPNVRYLGKRVDGLGRPGEAFSFEVGNIGRTVVIDPASSKVLSCTDDRQAEVIVEAGFTHRGP